VSLSLSIPFVGKFLCHTNTSFFKTFAMVLSEEKSSREAPFTEEDIAMLNDILGTSSSYEHIVDESSKASQQAASSEFSSETESIDSVLNYVSCINW